MIPYKICCLTYKELNRLVLETIQTIEDSDIEIMVIEGLREEIINHVIQAEREGVEIIIGGGANASIASQHSNLPIVNYRLTVYDYLEAIDKAFVLGHNIVIVTYMKALSSELLRYIKSLDLSCYNLIYDTTAELKQKLKQCGCDVVIGASHAIEVAKELGMKGILIYPGQTAILDAIAEAKKIAIELRRQREKSRFSQAVIDYSTNALILVEPSGVIIDFNKAAQMLFDKDVSTIKGALASNVLPESGIIDFLHSNKLEDTIVKKINGQDILCRWVRLIGSQEDLIGMVGILSSMSEINRAHFEYQAKMQMNFAEKGFRAKMHFSNMIGLSAAIKAAKEEAIIFAQSDASVLIYGETGVGKELFAQSIHNASPRKKAPFIAVNCAALPENLLESELFGYDEGAFTGGKRGGKKGLFELANEGTIFLDEIGELPPTMQTRLLRVLQEREVMHVGGDRVIPVNVRVISATNRNIEDVSISNFRSDLFYRLSALELMVPPLKDRKGDAILLFEYFYRQKSALTRRKLEMSPILQNILCVYSWPGNIRELQNVSERFALYADHIQQGNDKTYRRCLVKAIGEDRLLADILKGYQPIEKNISVELTTYLQEIFAYNKEQLAEKLDISRTTLWRMLKDIL